MKNNIDKKIEDLFAQKGKVNPPDELLVRINNGITQKKKILFFRRTAMALAASIILIFSISFYNSAIEPQIQDMAVLDEYLNDIFEDLSMTDLNSDSTWYVDGVSDEEYISQIEISDNYEGVGFFGL